MQKPLLIVFVAGILFVALPHQQSALSIPDFKDLKCLNFKFIRDVANCYIGGFGSIFDGLKPDVSTSKVTLPFNLHFKFNGFSKVPDQVSWIRQTSPVAEHLDLLFEQLQEVKVNLADSAEAFHDGLMSEAKTQEEIMKIIAFEEEVLKHASGINEQELGEFISLVMHEKIEEFQEALGYIRTALNEHLTDEMIDEYRKEGHDINNIDDLIAVGLPTALCFKEPFICKLFNKIVKTVKCLMKFDRTSFENGFQWITCFFSCKAINYAVPCTHNVFERCGAFAWIGDFINKVIIQYLNLEPCVAPKLLPQEGASALNEINQSLDVGIKAYDYVITEGGPTVGVRVRNTMPPATYCFDIRGMIATKVGLALGIARILSSLIIHQKFCNVFFEVWTTNYFDSLRGQNIDLGLPVLNDFIFGEPVCRNGFLMSQLKIGEHGYNADGENQCKLRMNQENFDQDYVIPVRATADMKYDGDRDVFMTIKLVVGNLPANTLRAKILVQDNDAKIPNHVEHEGAHSVCRSTSDPHLTTFDGSYYNHMYLGYFTLYRHRTLQYEVQMAYQRCSVDQTSDATCNCGVAVRSGDDVFVVERCRKDDGADQPLRAQLYVNGNLTLGTFIYSEYEGQRYHVVLPHGTTVRIVNDEHPNNINVMVKPSAFDHGEERIEGLCGQHTGNKNKDYLMPDDSIYNGDGHKEGNQPHGFITAYRASGDARMFEGVSEITTPLDVGRYCRCHYLPVVGSKCRCDSNIVEMCDMIVGDDVTETFTGTAVPSNPGQGVTGVTLDEAYVPGDMPDWSDGDINQKHARADCEDYTEGHAMAAEYKNRIKCPTLGSCKPHQRVELGCMDDIRLTQGYSWMRTTREAIKDQILDRDSRPLLRVDKDIKYMSDLMCHYDCHDNGACVEGLCQCNEGWTGATCNVPFADDPLMSQSESIILCDVTTQPCSHAVVTGYNFDSSMKCYLTPLKATAAGPVYTNKQLTVGLVYISQHQVACMLPENFMSSYNVFVWWEDQTMLPSSGNRDGVNFITYDSDTTMCDVDTGGCREL